MKKSTKKLVCNLIGLIITGVLYVLIVMPILMGEHIRLPNNGKMFGVMLLWVIAFPLLSFLIPGIIALLEYTKSKTFWRYFYYAGWIIYILVLIFFSFALGNHSMN